MLYYMKIMILNFMILCLMVLVGVAFLTLFERKLLSYIQIRKGPNKVNYMGLMQPFSDGIKLFSKENLLLLMSLKLVYYISPMIMFILSMILWIIYPFILNYLNMEMGLVIMLCIMSMSVYPLVMSGWSSNTVYSLMGSIRGIAQMISYEVSMILIMMSLMIFSESLNFLFIMIMQFYMPYLLVLFPISLMLLISFLAEMNRTPFDFSEGESELVSGFNVEYMSGGFILIFLSEYMMIIFMSMLFIMLVVGFSLDWGGVYLCWLLMIYLVIMIRSCLPRFRYDKLMFLNWLVFLPLSMNYLLLLLLFNYLSYFLIY